MTDLEKPWYVSTAVTFLRNDVPQWSGLPPDRFARDVQCLERRVASEGESFLTKSLPRFGKHFDACLQLGRLTALPGFRCISRRRRLPAFLRGLTELIFDGTGKMVDDPSTVAILLIRQMCYWWKKVEKEFDDDALAQHINDFKTVDCSLPVDSRNFDRRVGTARGVIEEIFRDYDWKVPLNPQHGPGAVANRETVVEKRRPFQRFDQLLKGFPTSYFYPLVQLATAQTQFLERPSCMYGLSRTEFVPKDSSGPRVIGLEPREYMWIQQGLKARLYTYVENHELTRGHVNFTDQSINRQLALNWRDYETLDMSKASDRNSLALVEYLFQNTGVLRQLKASRTPGTVLPNGELLMFRKFAPMGSACCFPVQALVYFSLAVAGLHHDGWPLFLAARRVFVYGDDLIVPRGHFPSLNALFESVGLKFNLDKCCTQGKFRESCGLDAYDGVDVTPIKAKRVYPKNGDPSILKAIVEHHNLLFRRGYWNAATEFRRAFEENNPWRFPETTVDLPILAWLSTRDTYKTRSKRSRVYVYGYVLEPKYTPANAAWEAQYLHESLSRGGPVGRFVRSRGRCVRVMDQRYALRLRKRWISILAQGLQEPTATHPLQSELTELASTQTWRQIYLLWSPRTASRVPESQSAIRNKWEAYLAS